MPSVFRLSLAYPVNRKLLPNLRQSFANLAQKLTWLLKPVELMQDLPVRIHEDDVGEELGLVLLGDRCVLLLVDINLQRHKLPDRLNDLRIRVGLLVEFLAAWASVEVEVDEQGLVSLLGKLESRCGAMLPRDF